MISGRAELNEKLKSCITDANDRDRVFFNPPDKQTLTYPCIIYHRRYGRTQKSNNINYLVNIAYDVQLISKGGKAHEDILNNILKTFSSASYDSEYDTDGLQHSILTVFYRL